MSSSASIRVSPAARWDLHDRALQALLQRLDADPAEAGDKYEQLRRGLIKMFERRGALVPDQCADETIDRVAGKLAHGAVVDDLFKFAHGVARLVWLEQGRRPAARETPFDIESTPMPLPTRVEPVSDDDDPRLACFERCLSTLGGEARELILKYYVDVRPDRIRARATLARALGLSRNALRSRAQRIRDRLERCTMACIARRLPGRRHDD